MKDMYGHEIVLIGNGFGVSTTFNSTMAPEFALFHESDGFRQSLFSVAASERPHVINVFDDRLRAVLTEKPKL